VVTNMRTNVKAAMKIVAVTKVVAAMNTRTKVVVVTNMKMIDVKAKAKGSPHR